MKNNIIIFFLFSSLVAASQNVAINGLPAVNFDKNCNEVLSSLKQTKGVNILSIDSTGREPWIRYNEENIDSIIIVFYKNKVSSVCYSFSSEKLYSSAKDYLQADYKEGGRYGTNYPDKKMKIVSYTYKKKNIIIKMSRQSEENKQDLFEIFIYNKNNGMKE